MLRYLMTMFMSSRNHVRTQAGGGFFFGPFHSFLRGRWALLWTAHEKRP